MAVQVWPSSGVSSVTLPVPPDMGISGVTLRSHLDLDVITPPHEKCRVFSGYTDDVWTVSKFTQKSYDSILDIFDHFALTTGLKMKYDKSLVLQIGSMEKLDAKLYSCKPIIWTDEPLEILGIWIYTDIQKVMKMNFD